MCLGFTSAAIHFSFFNYKYNILYLEFFMVSRLGNKIRHQTCPVTKVPVIGRDRFKTGLARSSFDARRSGLPAGDGRSFRVSFRSARVMCRRIMRWPALLMAVRWSWPVRHERVIRHAGQGCRSARQGLSFSKQVIKADMRLQIQRKLTVARWWATQNLWS